MGNGDLLGGLKSSEKEEMATYIQSLTDFKDTGGYWDCLFWVRTPSSRETGLGCQSRYLSQQGKCGDHMGIPPKSI